MKNIDFNHDAIYFWEAFFKDDKEKRDKYKLFLKSFVEYLFTDIKLGADKKFGSVDRFFKSEQFKNIELNIENEKDYICVGMAIAIAIQHVENQLVIQEIKKQQEKPPTATFKPTGNNKRVIN